MPVTQSVSAKPRSVHRGAVRGLAALPGNRVASVSYDWSVKVWDLNNNACLTTFTVDAALASCTVLSDGITLAAGDKTGAIHFFQLMGI